MNRIYDLHYEISPLDALLTDTVEQANEKIMRDINVCEKHAAVTADISCRFAVWIDNQEYKRNIHGGWGVGANAKSTDELFEEFCKTI